VAAVVQEQDLAGVLVVALEETLVVMAEQVILHLQAQAKEIMAGVLVTLLLVVVVVALVLLEALLVVL
jgi:hypothetical protein